MVFIKFNLTYFLISNNVWPEGPSFIQNVTFSYAVDMMIGELYVITFVTAIKITMDWLQEQKRVTALEGGAAALAVASGMSAITISILNIAQS